MTGSLDALRATLLGLHQAGLAGGLAPEKAEALVRALSGGSSLDSAGAQVGLDGRLVRALGGAAAPDLPGALTGLAPLLASWGNGALRLRSAGSYPLVLAVSGAVAWSAMAGLGFPALGRMPGGGGNPSALLVAGGAGALMALVLLASAVLGRLRVPWLSVGWVQLDRSAFMGCVCVLHEAGASPPEALRGALAWLPGSDRAARDPLADALVAGLARPPSHPLLAQEELTLLSSAAAHGVFGSAARALALQQQVTERSCLPQAAIRIQALALLIAGAGVLSLWASWYLAFGRVLEG